MTRASSIDLTADTLRSLLHYDADTGVFTWIKPRPGVSRKRAAGSGSRYLNVAVNGVRYLGHRLAWLYVHGEWPADEIDHINGDKLDNRLVNLRLASRSQNLANKPKRSDCKAPLKGIRQVGGRWVARLGLKGKTIYLGRFDTAEQAHAAYLTAARAQHGSFAHG